MCDNSHILFRMYTFYIYIYVYCVYKKCVLWYIWIIINNLLIGHYKCAHSSPHSDFQLTHAIHFKSLMNCFSSSFFSFDVFVSMFCGDIFFVALPKKTRLYTDRQIDNDNSNNYKVSNDCSFIKNVHEHAIYEWIIVWIKSHTQMTVKCATVLKSIATIQQMQQQTTL